MIRRRKPMEPIPMTGPCRVRTGEMEPQFGDCHRCGASIAEICRDRAALSKAGPAAPVRKDETNG